MGSPRRVRRKQSQREGKTMLKIHAVSGAFLTASLLAFAPQTALADASASETVTAATHADLAAQSADIKGVHTHLHHVLNCLVGPNGNGFDAKELNPCANAGNGAIPDTTDAAKQKLLNAAADKARAGIVAADLKTAQADAREASALLKRK
jgi:hypothetical protein